MSEEKKEKRGGYRPNAGRPKKDYKNNIIELFDISIKREDVVAKLGEKIKAGDMRAIQLYFNYLYGKPKETIEQTTELNINSLDISRMISFDPPLEIEGETIKEDGDDQTES